MRERENEREGKNKTSAALDTTSHAAIEMGITNGRTKQKRAAKKLYSRNAPVGVSETQYTQ